MNLLIPRLHAVDGAAPLVGRRPGRAAIVGVAALLAAVAASAQVAKPDPAPAQWRPLIGEYGDDANLIIVYEGGGRLHALIEGLCTYTLTEVSDAVLAFPETGLLRGGRLIVRRRADGRVAGIAAGARWLPRRPLGPEHGGQLRVAPVRPVGELLREALAATPPTEEGRFGPSDLVDLASVDTGLRFDIRYATANNFLGTPFYQTPRVFLQRPAAEALHRAHRALGRWGYGLLIFDGYRPWYVTKVFWHATPDSLKWLVADPARGSRHNRGAAVDLTLYHLATGEPVEMVGTYDEATPRSLPDYPGGTGLQRWHRELLRRVMEAEGFTVYPAEWWHFDFRDWREYPILNVPFERLAR